MSSLREKQKFFDTLNSLGYDSPDEVDEGIIASSAFLSTTKPTIPIQTSSFTQQPEDTNSSNFAPKKMTRRLPWEAKPAPRKDKAPEEPPRDRELRGDIPKTLGKRKRGSPDTIKLAPRPRRIFEDFVFYFFPDSDISPARNGRIRKAIEFGAIWRKKWTSDITHVIFDKDMPYKALPTYLKIDTIPDHIIIVVEKYMSDSLISRRMQDSDRAYYKPLDYYEVTGKPEPSWRKGLSLAPLPAPRRDLLDQDERTPSPSPEPEVAIEAGAEEASRFSRTMIPNVQDDGATHVLTPNYDDALETAIGEAKAIEHLPLDEDEDNSATSPPAKESETETEDESSQPPSKLAKKGKNWQENFQCMEKHDGSSAGNPNSETIKILEEMCSYYDRTRDQWRTMAYRRAIATLRKQDRKIITKDEAQRLPYIGERLAAKIEEIVWTKRLRRLENAKLDPHEQTLSLFNNIYGVGLSQATKWVIRGYKTLKDLEANVRLTDNQKIGIDHFDDFQARIPRNEVFQHGEIVRKTLESLDGSYEVHIMGSYRRGATSSGDIDLVITKPNAIVRELQATVFEDLIPRLYETGFMKASLATRRSHDDGTKFHGASVLPDSTVWRRIDLLLVPWDELGAALIYFTGNDIFNRSLRLLASKKGMRLNQRGLYKDVMRGPGRIKATEGTLVESHDEKKIFEILGVPWRPPHHRIC